ncbi:NAD(P)H-dependent oxidoreductase [Enorma burkinafasonensis]|uniref:NAD(P)H-dependent oxidoreductase n=1 Tax=Enorma burkinafasonensis TaxID=2590867 RepID=UPI0011A52C50|nr:NAD(P)H-dependent oxidoreductase [Enorma burkinafasonensis]
MHTLVVYCHPYENSFCHGMLDALCRRYEREGTPYEVIDLYADGFDPVLSRAELAVYNEGTALDPLVTRYQQLIAGSDRLVFIFPIWWNDVPAMLKGWLDKVLLAGFSWEATGTGLKGTLTYIESAEVYTASSNPTSFIREQTGDAIQRMFIEGTLWQLGIERGTWENLGGMDTSTPEERAAFLRKLAGE